jgi:hypothetical protein
MGKEVIDFNHDQTNVTNTGQAIVAIDVAAFGDVNAFKARVDTLVRDLRGSRRMPGVERIWLPGEQSQAKRIAYARDGIPIAAGLMRNLDQLAAELGIAAERVDQLEAGHVRHLVVADDQRGPHGLRLRERDRAILRGHHLEALAGQAVRHDVALRRRVVADERVPRLARERADSVGQFEVRHARSLAAGLRRSSRTRRLC